MTSPAGGQEPSAWGGTEQIGLWIALLEFGQPSTGRPILLADVQALIEHLREWHSSGLWHPDRYAIQLLIPGQVPDEALLLALAYHRAAGRSVGVPPATLVRVEVVTVEEFESEWDDGEARTAAVAEAAGAAPQGLLCDELFTATRSLRQAQTRGEVTDTLIHFVTAVGGRVEAGVLRHQPGAIEVDLSLEGGETRHATAEAFSVAGLIIEQSLPVLLADTRDALARLQEDRFSAT